MFCLAGIAVVRRLALGTAAPGAVYLYGALLYIAGLMILFGLQHSVMARPTFKRWLQRRIPEAAERSSYMLATAVVVFAMCLLWQPLPDVLWQAESEMTYNIMLGIGLGFILMIGGGADDPS